MADPSIAALRRDLLHARIGWIASLVSCVALFACLIIDGESHRDCRRALAYRLAPPTGPKLQVESPDPIAPTPGRHDQEPV